MKISKNSVAIRLSSEEAYWYRSLRDPAYNRKIERTIEHPPTDEQWNEYRRVKAAWEIVKDSEFFDWGCSCDHPSLNEPETRTEYVYAETHDEWLDRCQQLHRKESE